MTWRRSVYIFHKRSNPVPFLQAFDEPDTAVSCTRRVATTAPSQALMLLNDPFVRDQARHLAARVVAESGTASTGRIERAYWLALARAPRAEERAAGQEFLDRQTRYYEARGRPEAADRQALVDLCQVLVNLNESVYVK